MAKSKKAKRIVRDWVKIIDNLKKSKVKGKKLRFEMGSAGSAQVTRIRLLAKNPKLYGETSGNIMRLSFSKF